MQFFDTNILVYSFDANAPSKQARALTLIENALNVPGSAAISSQVVQEFLNLATRKFAVAIDVSARTRYLEAVLLPLCQHYPSALHYQRAVQLQARYQLPWYDSLIVASAQSLQCSELLSEDFQHGQRFDALTVVNPFR
jgi:predicted nucleic acid-binding protein